MASLPLGTKHHRVLSDDPINGSRYGRRLLTLRTSLEIQEEIAVLGGIHVAYKRQTSEDGSPRSRTGL